MEASAIGRFLERCLELGLVVIASGQHQEVLTAPLYQLGRQDQKIGAKGVEGRVEIISGQAQPLEPRHEVVSEQQQLKEGHVGDPIVGGDFSQGVVVEQLANVLLDRGVRSLEPPHSPGMRSKVGHQNVVGQLVALEERQWPGFDRVLGKGTADHHRAVRALPGVGLITELSHLPSRAQLLEFAIAGAPPDRGVLLGHHGVATPPRVEEFHESLAEASGICPDADPGPGDGGRHFL